MSIGTFRRSLADTTARKTYDLLEEPSGLTYRQLLEAAMPYCKAFVLSAESWESPGLKLFEAFQESREVPAGPVRRFVFNHDSVDVLKTMVERLYGWSAPDKPENLGLLRADGSPWLVTVSAARLGYLELSATERLLVASTAPSISASLFHQGAVDTALAMFERNFERANEVLANETSNYVRTNMDLIPDAVMAALKDWLQCGENARVSAALDVIKALHVVDLAAEVKQLEREFSASGTEADPLVYRNNQVLRERWRIRYRNQIDQTLASLGEDILG
jgi:hypothetical protein